MDGDSFMLGIPRRQSLSKSLRVLMFLAGEKSLLLAVNWS